MISLKKLFLIFSFLINPTLNSMDQRELANLEEIVIVVDASSGIVGKTCSICQQDFAEGDQIILGSDKFRCTDLHVFHKDCISRWAGPCPLCRSAATRQNEDNNDEVRVRDFHRAVVNNDRAQVIALLDQGVDVNAVDPVRQTALMHAIRSGYVELVALLLRRDALVTPTNYLNETALHYAAARGSAEILEKLIEAGADIEAVNTFGETPLIEAADRQKRDAVRILLAEGANVQARDGCLARAYDYARIHNDKEILKMLTIATKGCFYYYSAKVGIPCLIASIFGSAIVGGIIVAAKGALPL